MAIESIRSLGGESDAIINTSLLLRSWGFGKSEIPDILKELESPERPYDKIIDIGTTALDCEKRGDYHTDPYMGHLILLGAIREAGIIFQAPSSEILTEAHAGGLGNAANAVAHVLKATFGEGICDEEAEKRQYTWAVMAWLGGDEVGNIWKAKIDPVIDKSLLQTHPKITFSGLADVRVQEKEFETAEVPSGERAIRFYAAASGATEFTGNYLLEVLRRNPFNVNVSYPGLFPDGADRSNGVNLAWFVREAQRICPCVSMDIHSFTELKHIEPALPYIDMFNSNFADAAKVFLGKKVSEHLTYKEKMQVYGEMAEKICVKYFTSEGANRCRMFTITDKAGTFLIFQNPRADKPIVEYIPSPCTDIEANDKTGAGDVRFALQRLYVALIVNQDWKTGQFGWDQAKTAVNIGQIGTTLHIQGKDAHALDGISIYALEKLAKSGNEFQDLVGLKRALSE